jgi:hypothetical protein
MAAMVPQMLLDFDNWIDQRMEAVKGRGLAPLWGRAWEHAAKLAVAMSCTRYGAQDLKQVASGGGLEMDPTSTQWAIDFVKFTLGVQEAQVASRMGDNDFDRWCQEILRLLKKAGSHGRTEAELSKLSRLFRALEPRQQDSVMNSLSRREAVTLVQQISKSGRGKPRMAWTAREFMPLLDEDEEDAQ